MKYLSQSSHIEGDAQQWEGFSRFGFVFYFPEVGFEESQIKNSDARKGRRTGGRRQQGQDAPFLEIYFRIFFNKQSVMFNEYDT